MKAAASSRQSCPKIRQPPDRHHASLTRVVSGLRVRHVDAHGVSRRHQSGSRLGREAEIGYAVSGAARARGATQEAPAPPARSLTTDPDVVLLRRETIYRDGNRVGWLTSGGYGYTVGRSIGYGYIRDPENGVSRESVLSGGYELEVATERVPADVFLDPLYDPKMSRIKELTNYHSGAFAAARCPSWSRLGAR